MGNNVNDINKIINYSYRRKYAFLENVISKNDIKKYKNYVVLYVPKKDNLNYWIIEKYFFPKVDYIKSFKNLFKDDNNIIYLLYLKDDNNEVIYNIYYLYYFNFDIYVYKYSLEAILNYKQMQNDVYKSLYNKLNKKYHISNKIFFKKFYNKYIKEIVINFAKAELICKNYELHNKKNITELYELRDNLIIDMLKVKKSDLKKTTELIYLKKVRDIFPDTIYQYKCDWLGKQSLDLYIPSKKVAFEVQGEQHYKPINFFGGEQQFLKQKELDNKKAKLCQEHNVKLYYIGNFESNSFEKIIDKIVNTN